MTETQALSNAGAETTPQWTIEIQPRAEGLAPAVLIVGESGAVTIPLDDVSEFYSELMAAATRLAAIEAEGRAD